MNIQGNDSRRSLTNWQGMLSAAVALMIPVCAPAVTLRVVDGNGQAITEPFRWLIEEDNTALTVPGQPGNDTISLVIHKSHAAVVTNGSSTLNNIQIPIDPDYRYVVSVMADGYALGGSTIAAAQNQVTVVLHAHPIPTAQITVLAFNDNNPINNAPEPAEPGLPGCKVILADVGGGPIMQDAFGNPLGTTYRVGPFGDYIPDPETTWRIETMGDMNIYTDANGRATIKHLPMGKYGVQVIPPTGTDWAGVHAGSSRADKWMQTATIEGTLTVDAWVAADEPSLYMEGFGPGFYHVFFGFVRQNDMVWATNPPALSSVNQTIVGTNIFNHFGRPPNNQLFAEGPPVSDAWIGLNEIGPAGLPGRGLYIAPCEADGSFAITNVPPGAYQLVTWDKPLDALFGFNTIEVTNAPGKVNVLGNVLSYRWFGTFEGSVFYDGNQNGFRDPGEEGIAQQAINLRYRDGRVYMGTVTDISGKYEMAEVFPFFKWLVAEVDFARFKATGMTAIVDEGGTISPDQGWTMPSDNNRNPQPQYETDPVSGVVLSNASGLIAINNPNTGNNLSRTETGPVLTEAMHLFLNQNNRIDWGKINYAENENGGISGIVFYSITRAENDPREAVGDPWEPGVPRVQMVLYSDTNFNKIIDDLDNDGGITLADVDNYPLGWADGGPKGSEDVDYDDDDEFDPGDALQIAWTDSWDDAMPSGSIQLNPPVVLGKPIIGSDNYGTWNQIRPGVFDGGYAFTSYFPGGMVSGSAEVEGLPVGMYIVQAAMPPGYEIQTEESKNVDFGDAYKPSRLWIPPECVGELHLVPTNLTLFPA
ncbi:MAG TPA: SdrD B-like domain-containing protein, partial [Clostridia bacterium]|nr:SdrD B-like domain-containing protein [Clostridia bacterium]